MYCRQVYLCIKCVLLFLGMIWSLCHSVYGQWPQGNEDDDPVSVIAVTTVVIDAILGGSVSMPCDIEPVDKDDIVHMVLWFRERGGKPLFSYDVRGRPVSGANTWSDKNIFGNRAYFHTISKPAALTIENVSLEDEGVYRCRVDFKNSPTRNYQVNVTVIVPPQRLMVYDKTERPINESIGFVGPLIEGSDLLLKCEVNGGKPPPKVSWLINDKLVTGSVDAKDGVIINRLQVPRVTREMFNSTFKCQASNSKKTRPLEKGIRLELYLKPISVKILDKPKVISAGLEHAILCESVGSRPQAEITWWRESKKFRKGRITQSANDSAIVSTLVFTPDPDDDGHTLRCIADNPYISGSAIDDILTLDIVYPPQVTLQLGNKLKADDIKEGDDVYFECNIRANPKEHKITWFHNGLIVTHNVSSGVILSTRSLVLQGVTRHDSGRYSCVAANAKGETTSDPVALRVQFAPVCRTYDVVVVGASIDEAVRVRCHVTADPTDVKFIWQFNNSGENYDVSSTRFGTGNGSTSELMYTPNIERDYGTLACWGKNSIGRQAEPCIFQIVPAAKPGPLRNCTLRTASNISQDILEIECVPGYDGGMTQHFILEAYESRTMRNRLNLSSDVPTFRVDLADLLPTSAYTPMLHVVLYAANPKGRSDAFILEDIALKDAEKRTESVLGSTSGLTAVPLAALLCVVALVIGLAVLVIVVVTARKRQQPHGSYPHPELDASKQKNSLLEINDGERRYVVSYTLKTPADCIADHHERQPDILSAPRGTADVMVDSPPKRPDNFFPRSDIINEDCNRDASQASNFTSSYSSEPNRTLSPKSDGTIRQTREGILPRTAPLPYHNAEGTLPRTSRQTVPLKGSLPRTSRTLSRTPVKASANGGVQQIDQTIGSIPGPESCV